MVYEEDVAGSTGIRYSWIDVSSAIQDELTTSRTSDIRHQKQWRRPLIDKATKMKICAF